MLTAKVKSADRSWASQRNLNPNNWFSGGEAATSGFRRVRGKTAKRIGLIGGLVVGCGTVLCWLNQSVEASEYQISLPKYPWTVNTTLKSFDHATLRRGWLVYRTVCRTCHSLRYIRFMDLADTTHTVQEAKEIAEEFEVEDGPDDRGEYYTRPCKLNDRIPSPFPNEQAARVANFGAYPPDLSQVVLGRSRGIDYTFSLLTGFMDPPAGMQPEENQHFNVYFAGGFTSMPRVFFEDMVEYDDGTPATESQMAKDVVEFLTWTAYQEHDTRKLMTIKAFGVFFLLTAASIHLYRRYWSIMKTQRIAYVPFTKFSPSPPAFSLGNRNLRSKKYH